MLKQKIKNLFKSEFLRNALTLISGVGLAQLIPIIMQTFLRRMFLPEVFGAFAVYMSMVGILVIISSLRYQMAIVIPKKDQDAANIFFLTFFINLVFFIILLISIILFKNTIANILDFPTKYISWLYFLPFSVFLFSVYDSINYWLIRKKAFKSSAINKISRRSFEGLTQATFGFSKQAFGLIIGDLIGNVANNISGIFQAKKNGLSLSLLDKKYIFSVMKKYVDFPKNSIPALLNTAGTLLPVIFINKFYSESITGYFDLARIVLSVPSILISVAISNVLLQNISEKVNKALSIKKELLNVFYVLAILGIIELAIIVSFGPSLFTFVFGDNGTMSGILSQTLIFSFVFKFIVSPLSFVFIALRKIKIISIWQSLYFLSILSLILFKSLLFNDFIKIYVIIDIILYSLYFILIFIAVKKYEKKLITKI